MAWEMLRRVQNKDSNAEFLMNCKLNKDCLDLIILQNSEAWSMKQEALDDLAQKMKMKTTDYLKRLKENFDSENVELKFVKNDFVVQCTINNLKVKYLQCKLTKVQNAFECIANLLHNMYNKNNVAVKEINILQQDRNNYKKSATNMESKLNEFISRKQKDEDILYSNFALVLNEKKARIQHLTELLEAFRHGRPTVNPPPKTREKHKASKTPKVEVKNEVSNSEESEADYNTDDEKPSCGDPIERTHTSNNPSTSNSIASNLLLDEPQTFHALPKRVKYEHQIKSTVSQGTSKASSFKDVGNKKMNKESNTKPAGYNTQDLLDCL